MRKGNQTFFLKRLKNILKFPGGGDSSNDNAGDGDSDNTRSF